MPAVVKRTVGSFVGIKDAEGMCLCPCFLKNSMYSLISSKRVVIAINDKDKENIKMCC